MKMRSGWALGAWALAAVLMVVQVMGVEIARAGERAEDGTRQQKPNIVFIMADDLGYGHVGVYGQEKIRTPNIDKLASQGMRFTDFYAGCTVCAPSRSVLMTGLHMGHTPVRGNSGGIPLRDQDVTIAEVLTKAGYATGGFGKWGLGDARTAGVAHRQGFDIFFGYYDQVHAHSYYPGYLWYNGMKVRLPGNEGRERDGLTSDKRGTYSNDVIMEWARRFIRRHKDEPFFCYIPTTLPHLEYLVPEESLKQYKGRWPEPNPMEGGHYAAQPTPRAAFAAMVTRLDHEVGRVLDLLEQLGLEDETIVIFASDNGAPDTGPSRFFNGNGPFRGHKRDMYEGGLRVPFIVRWPGHIEPGSVSHRPFYFPDVMPTLADLVGASEHVPEHIDGISFAPTLLGQGDQETHDFLYWEYGRYRSRGDGQLVPGSLKQAVRMGEWKAVRQSPDQPIELYNLKEDIDESHNVAREHPDVVARMAQIMAEAHEPAPPQIEPGGHRGWRFR